ncbi:uncharacterized protein ATC70_006630 [Mucor velutinosus]|uniref:U6 small nuclear RNA (adenine-(43)-N(6))-methyltransferase n=1 Tax=Mucor velutinosus TaxID=708070 RepID=A0AAN7DRA6_9FUNG|nr:hypothetical protein ATC70_006630 [Mucor velutinosus]
MHPRNIYNKEPDFGILAKEFASFRPFVKQTGSGRSYIDFKNPDANRQLCKCLLKKDFELDVDFPLDTLCPAVPNRLNYILWLEDLIEDTLSSIKDCLGIDIGVGASCIYPLLGCATNPTWRFLGTEISQRSVDIARQNVERNHLDKQITIKYNPEPRRIFLVEENTKYTFSMCNPPFYSSQEEIDQGLLNKELEPSAICTGSDNEMITKGGEFAFIKLMVMESLQLQQQIHWYTSMIGMKRTIRPLVRLLNDQGITNYTITNFTQGKTVRWAIAWSFHPERPVHVHAIETWRPVYQFEIKLPKEIAFVQDCTNDILQDLEIDYSVEEEDVDEIILSCTAPKNTWSRAARRQKKRQKLQKEDPIDTNTAMETQEPFVFRLDVSSSRSKSSTWYQIVWLSGGNKQQFEGFWSHLRKRVEEQCGIHSGTRFNK